MQSDEIKGYTDQSSNNKLLVNNNKDAEEAVLRIIDQLETVVGIDRRWLAIGKTHIEQGFMAINRSIFKPVRIKMQNDLDPIGTALQEDAWAKGSDPQPPADDTTSSSD